MIEQIGGSSASRRGDHPLGALFQTTAVLRIGAGVLLLSRHLWQALPAAHQFIWKEVPWAWKTAFEDAGVPYPHLVAPAVAVVLALVCASWILGFLTRFFSLLFMVVAVAALLVDRHAHPEFGELCWLYLIIAFTLCLFGSGAVSLDQLFQLGSRRKAPRSTF
ncbi:MAG: hypothetical protein KDK99_05245 [Verrucomicrobiales bacterium]|nr:hypothetical protein [Verrucomicrobiales bacterium]